MCNTGFVCYDSVNPGCYGPPLSDTIRLWWSCVNQELTGDVSTEANYQSNGGYGYANLQSINYSVFIIGSNSTNCDGTFTGDSLLGTQYC